MFKKTLQILNPYIKLTSRTAKLQDSVLSLVLPTEGSITLTVTGMSKLRVDVFFLLFLY